MTIKNLFIKVYNLLSNEMGKIENCVYCGRATPERPTDVKKILCPKGDDEPPR